MRVSTLKFEAMVLSQKKVKFPLWIPTKRARSSKEVIQSGLGSDQGCLLDAFQWRCFKHVLYHWEDTSRQTQDKLEELYLLVSLGMPWDPKEEQEEVATAWYWTSNRRMDKCINEYISSISLTNALPQGSPTLFLNRYRPADFRSNPNQTNLMQLFRVT